MKQTARIVRNNVPLTILPNGTAYGEPIHVSTVANARLLPNPPPPFISIGSAGETVTGGYYWHSTSTATDDGVQAIQVSGITTGRYIPVSVTTSVGGAGLSVASITALKATLSSVLTDNQPATVQSPGTGWVWSASTGAGFESDDATIIRPNDVLLANNGRWYSTSTAPVVSTVAALRSATSGRHSTISVLSHSSVGDGGGGSFDYDAGDTTSSDDGGTVIVAGTRRYKRRYTSSVNARWFGMIADARSLSNVGVTASSSTITSASFVAGDVEKVIQIVTRANPATGTVAVLSNDSVTGTVTTLIGSNLLAGSGTAFTTELFVGQHIKIGSVVAQVTKIISNTQLRCNQSSWASSASGLSMTKYGVVGTGTAFTTELHVGKGIYIGSTFYNVQAIADNTHMAVWPLPAADASGQTLYRDPAVAAEIQSVTPGVSAVLTNMTAAIAVNGSNLSAVIGTDNGAALSAAIAAASAAKKSLEIPGASSHYMIFDAVDTLTDDNRGLEIFGHGWGTNNTAFYGAAAWYALDSNVLFGTVLRFCQGNGIVIDGDAVYEAKLRDIALIGPGFGSGQGIGIVPGREGSAVLGSEIRRNVALCNWRYGGDFYNAIGGHWDNMRVVGNATGLRFNVSTTQEFHHGEFNLNGIAMHLEEASHLKLSGNYQGNLVWGVLFNNAQSIELEKVYFENNAFQTGMGNSFDFAPGAGDTVQRIKFATCHSGDNYMLDPITDGTVSTIDDTSSEFNAMSVRPRWARWRTDGNYTHIDLTVHEGGIDSLGGSAVGFMRTGPITQVVPAGTPFTPELTDGSVRVIAITANETINAPTISGQVASAAASNYQEIWFHFRKYFGDYTVTWNAAYTSNPWSDAGTSGTSVIGFRHTGSNVWECIGYLPFLPPPPVRFGAGTPEGAVTAPVGTLFCRTDGGAGTTLYVKESGSGNTGWVGK